MDTPDGSALARLIEQYPEVAALVLIVAGLILARIARLLAVRGLGLVNRTMARLSTERGEVISERSIALVGSGAFWLVGAVALLLALRTLGTGRVFTWIDVPLAYLPQLVVGALIIGIGHVLGVLVRNLLIRVQGGEVTAGLAPRVVQAGIFLVGAMTGLQHMGLDVSFVAQLLILVVGVCLAGLSLAFALGARQYVANMVARPTVARFAPGDRIVINGTEGTIIEIHRVGVDLATAEGVMTIPAAMFAEQPILRREEAPTPSGED